MIAFLILSALGLGITQYLKKQQMSMRDATATGMNRQQMTLLEKTLRDDLQQIAYLNPSCIENPAPNVTVSTACSDLQIRGAITPYPGTELSTMTSLANYQPPANLSDSPGSLSSPYDALRILRFNFHGSFNCRLNRSHPMNPSTTAGQGMGAERFWVDSDCENQLALNGLYLITDVFDTDPNTTSADDLVPYSNLIQITALSVTAGVETQVDAASLNNRFNQQGGLGLSGFTARARLFPVKFIEYAYQPDGGSTARGIYRREINPGPSDSLGIQSWQLIEPDADGLQFYPVTIPSTGAVEHNRTMQFSADVQNNGLEDIRGVSPRIVLKAAQARADGSRFDNPMTATNENDFYLRTESKFFVGMRNSPTSN